MLPVPSRRCRSAVLIVAGSIHARPDSIEQVLALSLAHVRRSRTEPGYLAHSVHRDCEDALRLVFIEHWADADALRGALPGARLRRVRAGGLGARRRCQLPEMAIYEARAVSL